MSHASTGSKHLLAVRWLRGSDVREEALGGHPQALQRYALAVASHLGLIAAWYLFVKLGEVPKFVMPSPYDTVHALLGPNAMMAFAICFFPIVLTTARGLREVEPDLLDLVHTLKGSRWQLFTKIQ